MKVLILSLIALSLLSRNLEGVELFCEFKNSDFGYMCNVKYLNITSKDDRTITNVTGNHEGGKSNNDIKFFSSQQHNVHFFPFDLAKYFNNLEIVQIKAANSFKIHNSDLQQFGGKLKQLWLEENSIEILQDGLFKFNSNLEGIDLNTNKINKIERGTFSGLEKLTTLYLHGGNPCIDKYAFRRNDVINLISDAEYKCNKG